MGKLSVTEVKEKLDQGEDNVCYVDVRNPDEYSAGHVPGAVCIPLSSIEANPGLVPKDKMVIVGCHSGKRSEQAAQLLRSRGYSNVVELEGGFVAWSSSGAPVARLGGAKIPVMRQVQIAAGAIVVAGSLAALLINPKFLYLPLFIGSGLLFAGLSGWCGLAHLLEKMPWNRA